MIQKFECRRDSLTIRGHVYRIGDEKETRPAVVLCHGFLANDRTLRVYAQALAELGYVCYTFDFNGGGVRCRSDGKSRDMTVFTELEDLRSVMNYVKKQPGVDREHISLLGCSQGGLVSAMYAKRQPEAVEKLVLFYPALCIPDDARAGKMMFARFDPKKIPDTILYFPMRLGRDYAKSVIKTDVYKEIGGFSGPVLLLHGTNDKIVPISYSERAAKLYPDCTYHVIDGGQHGFRGRYDREAVATLREFMKPENKEEP